MPSVRPAQVLRRTAERKLAATVAETQGSLQDLAAAERDTLSWQGALQEKKLQLAAAQQELAQLEVTCLFLCLRPTVVSHLIFGT